MNKLLKPTRKVIALFLLLLLILTGCSSGSEKQSSDSPLKLISTVDQIVNHESTLESSPPRGDSKETATPIPNLDSTPKPAENPIENQQKNTPEPSSTKPNTSKLDGQLEVHFIDVGQADSILIKVPTGESMLIDAGNNGDSDLIRSYLNKLGIETLNVAVGTHPHEDHIGGLDTVINRFGVEKIYMPKASSTTKTFEDVLLAIKNKDLKVTTPVPGSSFNLGQAEFTILAPNSGSYSDENNYSIVLKMVYGSTSFLFTGDAEEIPEKEMLSAGYDLDADVLKVGHHGSSYSTSNKFLSAVSPKQAIISVGTGNQYDHPTQDTLDKLAAAGVEVYRTDVSGTIIATTDGRTITFDKKASPVKPNAPPTTKEPKPTAKVTPKPEVVPPVVVPAPDPTPEATPAPTEKNEVTVYVTSTGSKYHSDGCQYLKSSKIPISLEDAKKSYGPCSKCNPPK